MGLLKKCCGCGKKERPGKFWKNSPQSSRNLKIQLSSSIPPSVTLERQLAFETPNFTWELTGLHNSNIFYLKLPWALSVVHQKEFKMFPIKLSECQFYVGQIFIVYANDIRS